MFERFTDGARDLIFLARDQAVATSEVWIEPDHILNALWQKCPDLLTALFVDKIDSIDKVKSGVRKEDARPTLQKQQVKYSRQTKLLFQLATDEAQRSSSSDSSEQREQFRRVLAGRSWQVGVCHLILGILILSGPGVAKQILQQGTTLESARDYLLRRSRETKTSFLMPSRNRC